MTVSRPQIGKAEKYRGHTYTMESTPPDLIARVDGAEFTSAFFRNVNAARTACIARIDEIEKEKAGAK